MLLTTRMRRPRSVVGDTTSSGGRFRVLRPHARGGIGMVSVALDVELNREVALKEIQPEQADDLASRARFVLEAEVTGRLEHPGVVPVYGLGTSPEGRPYYAMRFVRGESLKEAIDRFHQADHASGSDPAERALALRQLLCAVPGRLQCGGLCPQPGRDPPRSQAGQYPAGALWRDTGG